LARGRGYGWRLRGWLFRRQRLREQTHVGAADRPTRSLVEIVERADAVGRIAQEAREALARAAVAERLTHRQQQARLRSVVALKRPHEIGRARLRNGEGRSGYLSQALEVGQLAIGRPPADGKQVRRGAIVVLRPLGIGEERELEPGDAITNGRSRVREVDARG